MGNDQVSASPNCRKWGSVLTQHNAKWGMISVRVTFGSTGILFVAPLSPRGETDAKESCGTQFTVRACHNSPA